jgi:RNA polymerase sigma-70 factor (ECF subfamily)
VGQDRPSFEDAFSQLSQPLNAYLVRMTGNPADADDLLQETLVRIARALPDFEGRSSLKNWSFRIATNVAIDFLRKAGKGKLVELAETDAPVDEDGEDQLVVAEMNDCIRGVIDSLPADFRSALVLNQLEGKTAAEVAEICDVTLATAKIRIHRAKVRLRDALRKQCNFYGGADGSYRCDRK